MILERSGWTLGVADHDCTTDGFSKEVSTSKGPERTPGATVGKDALLMIFLGSFRSIQENILYTIFYFNKLKAAGSLHGGHVWR